MTGTSFVITKVSWLVDSPMISQSRDLIVAHHYRLAQFLQANDLTTRFLVSSVDQVSDEFAISSDDLTAEGMALINAAHDRWVGKIDRGMSPDDVSILERALKKIRAAGSDAGSPAPKKKAVTAPKTAEPVSDKESVTYDKAAWHYDGDFPPGLPNEAGAIHIATFAAWAALNGLGGDDLPNVDALRARTVTPTTWFIQACDGALTSDDLSGQGNAFAAAYYLAERDGYLDDYANKFDPLGSIYRAPGDWEGFDAIAKIIDRRWQEWREGAGLPR